MNRRHKVKPVWHRVQCQDCGNLFDELSDPNASLELCHACMSKRWGLAGKEQPIQKDLNADAWWDDFVYEYERLRALGLIDPSGKEIDAAQTLSP